MPMTREQKLEAYAMRLDGYTDREIGEKMGVSRQYIATMFPGGSYAVQKKVLDSCIYPNVREWMCANQCGYVRFAFTAGIKYNTLRQALTKKTNMQKTTIDKILEVTGLTYEEAFYLPEGEKC